MIKYCLSYDEINSEELRSRNRDIKNEIAELLKENAAVNLCSPVASTIIFEVNSTSKITKYETIISETFGVDIHYYLCEIKHIDKLGYFEKNHGNTELNSNFRASIYL